MALAANGQTLVALDQQHAGIADFTVTRLAEIEALHRLLFIFTRRCEAWTARLGAANATAVGGTVNSWLMEIKHGGAVVVPILLLLIDVEFVFVFKVFFVTKLKCFACCLCFFWLEAFSLFSTWAWLIIIIIIVVVVCVVLFHWCYLLQFIAICALSLLLLNWTLASSIVFASMFFAAFVLFAYCRWERKRNRGRRLENDQITHIQIRNGKVKCQQNICMCLFVFTQCCKTWRLLL